jgi:hypothetical protein
LFHKGRLITQRAHQGYLFRRAPNSSVLDEQRSEPEKNEQGNQHQVSARRALRSDDLEAAVSLRS